MILRAHYKDIPWNETGHTVIEGKAEEKAWEQMRGRPVSVIAPPATDLLPQDSHCQGPLYYVANEDGTPKKWSNGYYVNVCPHLVEIGD